MLEGLLDNVNRILQESNTEKNYNIFQVLEVDDREVPMCRFLADILNPNGRHGKGRYYLNSFLKDVLGREDADDICNDARVYKEFPISEDRRIDIVIVATNVFIPIEVKLYAEEQRAQCFDYYTYSKMKDPETRVVYLTLWGNEPSSYSTQNHDGTAEICESDYICISFAKDIVEWIEEIVAAENDSTMKDLLVQYSDALRELTSVAGEETQMTLVEEMIKSEENFRGMLAISEIADKAKARLMFDVLADMESGLTERLAEKFGLDRENRIRWYEFRDNADEDFYKHYSTYPGINYVFKNVILPGGIQMWMRVEVEHCLFFDVCLFDPSADNGSGAQVDHPSEEIWHSLEQYADISQKPSDSWWVKWWYLPTGTEQKNAERDLVPDFKSINHASIDLIDKEKRAQFVDKCISVIENTLKEFLK